jgi:hypothetical protein
VLPDEPDVASGADGDSQFANCHTRVTLPVTGDTISPPLNMGTDLKVPMFVATLAIETNVVNSAGIAVVTK